MKTTIRKHGARTLPIALGCALVACLASTVSGAHDAPAFKAKEVVLVHGAWADGSSWTKAIPILERRGLHVTAVQLPLTSVTEDVATLQRAMQALPGPLLLVAHSYGGVVITEAGNDPKVSGLVYISAYAPNVGDTVFSLNALAPKTPVNQEIEVNAGFLSLSEEGIRADFAPDLPDREQQTLAVTQGPVAFGAFNTAATVPAWYSKPSWYMIAAEDRVISPKLEAMMAQNINAKTVTVHSSHVIMLSQPQAVAELIEQAARGRD